MTDSLSQLVTALGFKNFICPKCGGRYFKTIQHNPTQILKCRGPYDDDLREYKGCRYKWTGTWDDIKEN